MIEIRKERYVKYVYKDASRNEVGGMSEARHKWRILWCLTLTAFRHEMRLCFGPFLYYQARLHSVLMGWRISLRMIAMRIQTFEAWDVRKVYMLNLKWAYIIIYLLRYKGGRSTYEDSLAHLGSCVYCSGAPNSSYVPVTAFIINLCIS